tara:strand:+ start:762 stop:1298 length:537 start_codon:yes stop_codon:yes gene_type:complete
MKRCWEVLLGAGLLAGCVTEMPMVMTPPPPPVVPPTLAAEQVLVECRMIKDGDMLTAPRIITISGRKAEIAIVAQEKVPGTKKPVETGIKLSILPVLEDGRVAFTGSCSVKERRPASSGNNIVSTAFVTREAFFSGVAAERDPVTFQLATNAKEGNPIEITLSFTMAPGLIGRVDPAD